MLFEMMMHDGYGIALLWIFGGLLVSVPVLLLGDMIDAWLKKDK